MKLYFYKEEIANFGDDLNEWIWPRLLPNYFDEDGSHLVLGIGSILNEKLPLADKYTVLGAGWGYGVAPKLNENWNILCVRGKLTCRALGIPEEKAIIDPAYLLRDFFEEKVEKKYKISLIPHAISLEIGHWEVICDKLGINLIDIRTVDTKHFINEIKSSEKVLTEAMHGAIVADCFGIPWQGYIAYDHINSTKWNDWLSVFDYEVSLMEIDSLYKGNSNMRVKGAIKNEIKHILKSIGVWGKQWDMPFPKRTTKLNENNICKQIDCLIHNDKFVSTDRVLVDEQINKLKTIINSLK